MAIFYKKILKNIFSLLVCQDMGHFLNFPTRLPRSSWVFISPNRIILQFIAKLYLTPLLKNPDNQNLYMNMQQFAEVPKTPSNPLCQISYLTYLNRTS
jgi:hypothetical protein